jgi:ligand-binding sensor domain-containing protein
MWKRYGPEDGLADRMVLSVAVDGMGVKWFGTADGISRYDGVSWKTIGIAEGLPNARVNSVVVDRSGNVWFGTDGGVMCISGAVAKTFRKGEGPYMGRVTGIIVDLADRVWFCHGSAGNGVSVYDHGVWTHRSPAESGIPDEAVHIAACDSSGVLWFALNYRVVSFDGSAWHEYTKDNGLAAPRVRMIYVDSSNRKWFVYGSGNGVTCYDDVFWKTWTVANGLRSDAVVTVGEEGDGGVYACTIGGVMRFDGTSWKYLPNRERLISDHIFDMAQTPDGAMWFATACGLSRFDSGSWRTWTTEDGLPTNEVRAVAAGNNGVVWFIDQNKLCSFNGSTVTVYSTSGDGESIEHPYTLNSLAVDVSGVVWTNATKKVIVSDDLSQIGGIWCFRNGVWEVSHFRQGGYWYFLNRVMADERGNVWFATPNGLLQWDGAEFTLHRTNTPGTFWCEDIAVDQDNTLWFSCAGLSVPTYVSRFESGTWTNYDGFDERKFDDSQILQVEVDDKNRKWFLGSNLVCLDGNTWKTVLKQGDFSPGIITTFTVQGESKVWFGTTEQGLLCWDHGDWTGHRDPSLLSNYVLSLANGPDNTLWVGTWEGFAWFGKGYVTNHRTDSPVFDIAIGADGTLWAVTSRSIIRYDGSTWTEFIKINGKEMMSVVSIAVDNNGIVWAGTWGGLFRYDGREWKLYTTTDGLLSNRISAVAVDRANRKWFATNFGICMLDDTLPVKEFEVLPNPFILLGNHPNPFNASTIIEFETPYAGEVTLDVYDILGRRVRRIDAPGLPAGRNVLCWDGADDRGKWVSSGVYLYRVRAGGHAATGRMMMVK